ncbi:MAG: hypothetical protein ABJC12_05925 [Saprospiraceae bacterium]
MKNILFLLAVVLLSSVGIQAQSVPQGMRFQAIARDLDGRLLLKKELVVQVELLTAAPDSKVYYTETHKSFSNELGLLDFVIGEGTEPSGKFSDVPWSTEEMWVRISVKAEGDKEFQIVSTGQLYSVPYAQYAGSAGKIVDNGSGNGTRGQSVNIDQTSIYWALDGNMNSHKYKGGGQAVLGTTDGTDLTMITNNIPRMIIDKNGNINIMINFIIQGDLNVDGNTTLNGNLDVTNMAVSHFTGSLRVDKATLFNDALSVENIAPSQLTGSLDVYKTMNIKGVTTLYNTLDVTNMAATHMSGTLTVDKATILNSPVTVTNFSPTQMTGLLDVDKTMNVDGATTLNAALAVSGSAHLTGTLVTDKATTLMSATTVTNLAPTNLTGLLDVDKTMNVDGTTTLNNSLDVNGMSATHLTGTLAVDKSTTFKDAVTVENAAPTQMTGLLNVDQTINVDESTTMNSTLDVLGAKRTHLTGILTVDKEATFKDSLTVANAALTHLTGNLQVDGDVLMDGDIGINGPLTVSNMNPSVLTGAMEVQKLPTLKFGLIVQGGGPVGPDGTHLAFFDNTEGGTSDGIAIKLNDNHTDKENNFMTFYKGTGSSVVGRIEGYEFDDIADVPLPTSDEIWTAVCIAVADYNPISIVWTQIATAFNLVGDGWNNVTVPAFDIPDVPAFDIPDVPALAIPDVPAFVIPDVPGFVTSDVPGFVIPDVPSLTVGPYLCGTVHVCPCPCLDFSFTCCCIDETVCLIPEFTLFPGITIPDFPGIPIPDFPGIPIPDFPGIPIPDFPGIAIPNFPGIVIPNVPSFNLKNLFGEAPHMPTLSDILVSQGVCPNADIFNLNNGYFRRLADWAIENRLTNLLTADPIKLIGQAAAWALTSSVLDGGVVYGSKGADYAEYLPKLYQNEQFMKGDIVGVYNGRISKNTVNADQVLAITSQPIVLGNQPEAGKEKDFEKVAFLGQIPVFVLGPVNVGDYIIPSGKNDGVAMAVGADAISAELLSKVLGRAWAANTVDGISLINTSIGLRPSDIVLVLKKQGAVENNIQAQIERQKQGNESISNDIEYLKNTLGLKATSSNP